jgi:UPF0176 protein
MQPVPTPSPVQVAALYRFVPLEAFAATRQPLAALCCREGVKGTILLAREGVNGTIAGRPDAIAAVVAHLRAIPGLGELDVKLSDASAMPFHRMKVRLKREIVTMGVDGVDPLAAAGSYVEPAAWNALIDDPDTLVVDTRNHYEVGLGTFARAVDPGTRTFRDFPKWAESHRDEMAGRKVAMFCTGGIRCEKATAYVRSLGIEEVYHLKGGILAYLEQVPEADSRWHGECFVFDERVAVTHGLAEGEAELCRACRMPVTPQEKLSAKYREGICCERCFDSRSDEDRARYAERQRQVERARERGEPLPIGS